MENQEVLHEPAQAELSNDEVRLSDGRVVKMRETTGADDASVAQMLGNKVQLDGASAQILAHANALKSIVSIDGQSLPIMRSYNDFLAIARDIKSKDMQKLVRKYMELNFEADENNPLA